MSGAKQLYFLLFGKCGEKPLRTRRRKGMGHIMWLNSKQIPLSEMFDGKVPRVSFLSRKTDLTKECLVYLGRAFAIKAFCRKSQLQSLAFAY